MPRFDEMPEYRNRQKRTTHDLSHKYGFTATVAHLLPVFHDFLNPGETVDLSFQYNLRTQPLQSAAMVDINSHVEYFFVPMNLLFEPFGNKYFDIRDTYSSLYNAIPIGSSFPRELPVMDFSAFVEYLLDNLTVNVREGFENWRNNVYRLFDHLGYNTSYFFNGSDPGAGVQVNWNPNVFPYPILAYNCIYQYYYRLDTRERFDQLSFNWDNYYNEVNPVNDGDFFDYIQLHYRPLDNDYFTDVKVSPIVDVLNLDYKSSLNVVNDWLSRNSISATKILTSGSIGNNTSDSVLNSPTGSNFINPSSSIQTEFGFSSFGSDVVSGRNYVPFNGSDINTANIRALFANEKLWSITGRARKHYDDQVLAHFGFKVPHDPKHEISCFGHDKGKIHIGEVIQTAQAYDGNTQTFGGLGEIAGKGYGSLQNKPHRFTAPCHGVVMAILSFTPDYSYGGSYLKANAVSKPEDFFIPEYDHLGMQPLFGYEGNPQEVNSRNSIIGWQYRYEQWKRRFNRVSPAFTGAGDLDSWMLDKKPSYNGVVANNESYKGYLYRPYDLNQLMLVNYVTTNIVPEGGIDYSALFSGDPFVVDGYIHCKKVSIMSDYSLPRLDA